MTPAIAAAVVQRMWSLSTPVRLVLMLGVVTACTAAQPDTWRLPEAVSGEPLLYNVTTGVELTAFELAPWELKVAESVGAPPQAVRSLTAFTSDDVAYQSHYLWVAGTDGSDLVGPTIDALFPDADGQEVRTIAERPVTVVTYPGGTRLYLYAFGNAMALLRGRDEAQVAAALREIVPVIRAEQPSGVPVLP